MRGSIRDFPRREEAPLDEDLNGDEMDVPRQYQHPQPTFTSEDTNNSSNTSVKHPITITTTTHSSFDDEAISAILAQELNSSPSHPLPEGISPRDHQEDAMMRILAGQLRSEWRLTASHSADPPPRDHHPRRRHSARGTHHHNGNNNTPISPALERRLRDFQFAQGKRREKYGDERPWGILGLYDHLAGIRMDVEWAEDAAWRREHDEPYLSWSDFEESRDGGLNRPFFTYIILVVCTAMMVVTIAENGWEVEGLRQNPMIGPSARTLERLGAKETRRIVEDGEWYRLVSPMILHAGVIHYLLNMVALWVVGSAVELNHGFLAAAIIFFIPATGGTILSAIFLPEYISVGASGGIFGLIGACIADIAINWNLLFSKQVNSKDEGTRLRHVRVLLWLFFDILINCLVGLTPFVDNFTHLGGLVYGFLCGLSTMERLPLAFFGVATNCRTKFRNVFVRFSGLLLSVLMIMVTTVLLAQSDGLTSPCSYCRYLSCVPFPPWAHEDDKWWYCDDCAKIIGTSKVSKEANGYFSALQMDCPDGDQIIIDLTKDEITDQDWLTRQLPSYCRNNCDGLFLEN